MTSADALGRAVRERRQQLQLPQDLRGTGGPSPRTVFTIEHAAAGILRPTTRTQLERSLRWPPGYVDRLLAGTAGSPDDPRTCPSCHRVAMA